MITFILIHSFIQIQIKSCDFKQTLQNITKQIKKMIQKTLNNKQIIFLVFLLSMASCAKFVIQLKALQKQCFYQILEVNQKYSVDTTPKTQNKYQVQINHMIDGTWQTAYFKSTEMPYQNLNVHKLASASSTYSFCFKNNERQLMRLSVDIQSGLELMQFELLPDKNDSQNLERELNWLQNQKKNMFQILQRMQGLRASTEGLASLMSTKMIGFAIIGLIAIILVNFMFYKQLKKTFKQRKLI